MALGSSSYFWLGLTIGFAIRYAEEVHAYHLRHAISWKAAAKGVLLDRWSGLVRRRIQDERAASIKVCRMGMYWNVVIHISPTVSDAVVGPFIHKVLADQEALKWAARLERGQS